MVFPTDWGLPAFMADVPFRGEMPEVILMHPRSTCPVGKLLAFQVAFTPDSQAEPRPPLLGERCGIISMSEIESK